MFVQLSSPLAATNLANALAYYEQTNPSRARGNKSSVANRSARAFGRVVIC